MTNFFGDGYRGALVCAVLAVCLSTVLSAPARAQLCAGAADDDPRTASFCQALNTFFELYAEAAGEQVPEYQGTVYKLRRGKRDMYTEELREFDRMLNQLTEEQWQTLVRDYPQLLDTGMKRQDVVHSFLRFGRRR